MIKIVDLRELMVAPVQTIGRTRGATSSYGGWLRITPHRCQRVAETTTHALQRAVTD